VLLVNADDFGIYPAANAAVIDAIDHGIAASCSVMVLRSARTDEVEAEFRAQLEVVLDAGLTPTHLDWHCLADGGRADIFDVTLMLAGEYGIAVRAWLEPARRRLRARGLPVVDHDFLDSFSIERPGKAARYVRLLRGLPAGLTEWAVHPALANADDGSSWVRRTDHEFLVSAQAREVVEAEGITVIGWSTILERWRHPGGAPA
jgi:predicted glycoside hydrolase/deacetylase ChbG (UPF0249 family)